MHQNMGKLEYEVSTSLSQNLDIDRRTFYLQHLNQSLGHLNRSVSIFEDLYEVETMDSSTSAEFVHSIQLLAGVNCDAAGSVSLVDDAHKYAHAIRLWEKAINAARLSLQGITVGVQYENFPVILFNAAICYNEAKLFASARQLLQEAIQIMESNSDTAKYADVYQNAKDLNRSLVSSHTDSASEMSDLSISSEFKSTKERVLNVVLPSGEKKQYSIAAGEENGIIVAGNDEWVECEDNDLNCEVFEVYEDEDEGIATNTSTKAVLVQNSTLDGSTLVHINSISQPANESDFSFVESIASCDEEAAHPDDPSIYEGLTEDEAMELRYTRERYARFAARTRSCNVNVTSSMLPKIQEIIQDTSKEVQKFEVESIGECALELKKIHAKLDRILLEFDQLRNELRDRKGK